VWLHLQKFPVAEHFSCDRLLSFQCHWNIIELVRLDSKETKHTGGNTILGNLCSRYRSLQLKIVEGKSLDLVGRIGVVFVTTNRGHLSSPYSPNGNVRDIFALMLPEKACSLYSVREASRLCRDASRREDNGIWFRVASVDVLVAWHYRLFEQQSPTSTVCRTFSYQAGTAVHRPFECCEGRQSKLRVRNVKWPALSGWISLRKHNIRSRVQGFSFRRVESSLQPYAVELMKLSMLEIFWLVISELCVDSLAYRQD
jgi:hypothetical protein